MSSKYFIKLIKATIILAAIFGIAIGSIRAQEKEASPTFRSLFWMDEGLGVEVYLIDTRNEKRDFNLLVISDKDVKVIYRTEINSMLPVVKDLVPLKTAGSRNYYDVQYHFSKTTIWMALDFKIDGKQIDSLTRYFYGKIIPDEGFPKNP